MTVLLFTVLVDWHQGMCRVAHYVQMKRPQAITESFDEEGGDLLAVPAILEKHLERLYMLGPAAVPLSQAVVGALYAKRMEYAVREAVRDYRDENIQVLEVFRERLVSATDHLNQAIALMRETLDFGTKRRPSKK
ncbi:hypothetical protein GGR77_001560 [Xanthomonas translucens]